MLKLSKNNYRGIEYIRLGSLSAVHAESLSLHLNNRTLIKILRNDVILTDCVLYSVYESWYNSFILEKSPAPSVNIVNEPQPTPVPA